MTVSTTDSVIEYVSGGPAFPIPYRFLQNSDIQAVLVKQDGTSETLVLGSQYTLAGAGTQSGGTLTSAYAAGYLATPGAVLTISRDMAATQPTDLRNQGRFLAETHETVFDRLTMLIQQGLTLFRRALLRPIGKNYYDAEGRQIKNLADGAADQDVTNVRQVRSWIESAVAGVVGGFGWFIQSGIGAIYRTFQEKMRDTVNAEDYGAIGDGNLNPLSERFSTLAAAQAEYPFVTSLSDSQDWAGIYAAQLTGKPVNINPGVFVLTKELYPFKNGKWIIGSGVDKWEHLDPSIPKLNGSGTHFVAYGTFAKTRTLYGVTDMRTAGGVVVNPDSVNALDAQYSLTSFHNNDAADGVESTLRPFSCVVYVEPGAQDAGIRGVRIHPNFNGIAGYNDTMTTGLGDECDVGIFNDNAPHFTIDNCQVVGYWRIKGVLIGCVSRTGVQGANFFTNINKTKIQAGLAIRGGDQAKALATTSNSIDVPWADNHPFKNSGAVSTPKGTFTYTSTSKVTGTPNGTVLRFNGVSPNPSAASLGAGPVRISSGSGIGGMSITGGSVITGLDHSSMCLASNPLIGLGVSNALEISGTFRQPFFDNCYIQTKEDVIAHFHSCDDIRMSQAQFEANDFRLVPGGPFSPVHGGRIIAAPQDLANPIATASGSTSLSLYQFHCAPYVDLFPMVARPSNSKFTSPTGFFTPRRLQYPDLQIVDSDQLDFNALLTQSTRFNLAPGKQFLIRDSASANLITVSETSGNLALSKGQISMPPSAAGFLNVAVGHVFNLRHGTSIEWQMTAAGSWVPGNDATQNLASAAARINNSFFAVAPTVSSDRNLKKIRGLLSDAELAACEAILPKVYQMLDMIDDKGEEAARLHFGYIAQDVQQAFIDQNLDPARYALWGEDAVTKKVKKMVKVERQKVEKVMEPRERIEIRDGQPILVQETEEVDIPISEQVPLKNEDGSPALDGQGRPRYASVPIMEEVEEEVEVDEPDGFRQSLRYTELQVLKEAYLCTMIARQEERIAALEKQ